MDGADSECYTCSIPLSFCMLLRQATDFIEWQGRLRRRKEKHQQTSQHVDDVVAAAAADAVTLTPRT